MKHRKIFIALTTLFAVLCLFLFGCGNTPDIPDVPPEVEEDAPCDHENVEWLVRTQSDGFYEGTENLVCRGCGKIMDQRALPRTPSEGLEYVVNPDGTTCTVTGMGSCKDRHLGIPEEIDGFKVVAIGSAAFDNLLSDIKPEIEAVFIPSTVKIIESRAFEHNKKLEKVYVSDGVVIDWGVFQHCTSLKDVRLPADLKVLEGSMFTYCTALKEIDLPDGLEVIGDSAFSDCTSLMGITVPDSVKGIGRHAFGACKSLHRVDLGNGVETIGYFAFYRCYYLAEIRLPDSIEYLEGSIFAECRALRSVEISKNLKNISGRMFFECTSLRSISIPEGVCTVGPSAFSGCTSLAEIELPSTVTYVYTDAFLGCGALPLTEYEDALYLGSKQNPYTVLMSVIDKDITSVSVHSDTKTIYPYAFDGCTKLEEVKLPDGLITVGEMNFEALSSLKFNEYEDIKYLGSEENPYLLLVKTKNGYSGQAKVHPNTKVIGPHGFSWAANMTKAELPEGLVSICGRAFSWQMSLTDIKLPSGVKFIGEGAFSGCSQLKSVTVPGSVRHMGTDAFSHCDNLLTAEFLDGVTEVGQLFYSTPLETLIIPKSAERVITLPIEGLGYGKTLQRVIFGGTVDEWYEIYTSWDELRSQGQNANIPIKCSDGEIRIGDVIDLPQ